MSGARRDLDGAEVGVRGAEAGVSGDGRTRRDFLLVSAAGLGGWWLASGCMDAGSGWRPRLGADELGADEADLAAALRAYFGDDALEAVRVVGRAYGRRFEPDPGGLAADLREAVALVAGTSSLGPPREVLAVAVRTDFEMPTLASVEGWQLSVTEARLAALAEVLDLTP